MNNRSIEQAYFNTSAQQGVNTQPAQTGVSGGHIPVLVEIIDRISSMDNTMSDLHGIADRACGIRGEQHNKPAPASVPNGMLDQALDSLGALEERMNALCARMSRIA